MGKYKLCAFADEADTTLSGQIEALIENKISLIEIRGVDSKNIADVSFEEARLIKSSLNEAGIKVFSIGSPYGKIKLSDDFDSHFEKFKRTIEVANILEADRIRAFSFYTNDNNEKAREEVLRRVEIMAKYAKKNGVLFCHENEKGIFGYNIENCALLKREIPEIELVFDPANFVQCGIDTLAAADILFPNVNYMHIKDAVGDEVVPAGDGMGNIGAILNNYYHEGVLTIEPHLQDFVGLSSLEEDNGKSVIKKQNFKNNRESFAYAVKALRNIIGNEEIL